MLQALPDDILLGILQYASFNPIGLRSEFIAKLYLLGIFQRLRGIALPKIYSYMYFTFSTNENSRTQRYANKYSNAFAEYIDTNADIIALANCTHMVKTAKIYVDGLGTNHAEFHDIIEALKFCSATWPSITKLELDITDDIDRDDLSESQWEQLYCSSKTQCQALASTLPSVTGLILNSEHTSLDISYLFNQVSDAYANQLVKLSCWCDFVHADGHKLKVLQYLFINMGSYIDELPCVNSRTLVELRVYGITEKTLWAPFMDNKDDAVIEFPCLKRLKLEFAYFDVTEQTNVDKPEVLLKFPVLSSLYISSTDVCPFFKMARFPKKMEYINIYAPPAMLAQFKDLGIPTAKKATMRS